MAPPATPTTDATARPTAVVTVPPGAQGSAADRDQQRRTDVLVLYQAANALKAQDGSFPSTNGNVQTVCTYKDVDAACKLADVLPGDIPHDPFGANAGYWYSSDGDSVAIYASLEGDIPDDQKCNTSDAELAEARERHLRPRPLILATHMRRAAARALLTRTAAPTFRYREGR